MSSFPQDTVDPERLAVDGVSVTYQSLAGMPNYAPEYESYSLGKSLVHEVGHFLGLYHTFQNGCDSLEDYPAELYPTSGCPTFKDTCPDNAGMDPIHNYMDYSSDICLTGFTKGQMAQVNCFSMGGSACRNSCWLVDALCGGHVSQPQARLIGQAYRVII